VFFSAGVTLAIHMFFYIPWWIPITKLEWEPINNLFWYMG